MRRVLFALQLLIIALAAALAAAPLPQSFVERYYSGWFYPGLQARLTSWSNETALALFDFILGVLAVLAVTLTVRATAAARRERSVVRLLRGSLDVAALLAFAYVWFACAWGLNYARVPLEASIGYDESRIDLEAVRALAARAVEETNRGYDGAHAGGFPGLDETPPALVSSLHQLERRLGRPRPTTPGRPKRTMLGAFFRAAGTDGMHAPFMLETLLNPDLTPPERPAVLAHEWAHLAGFAPEDDASFVGLLAALRADAGARYSAWLSLAFEAAGQLPDDERRRLLGKLGPGPRRDQEAILVRLRARIEPVQQVSWRTYDQYLKAQGVREGLRNYSRVVQLLVGSGAIDWPK